jgi:phosphatidylglycerophosphate synthase
VSGEEAVTARTNGVLWVCRPAPSGIAPDARILGLPVARRVAVAAERAGYSRILFADAPGLSGALAGTRAERVGPEGLETTLKGNARLVVLRFGALPTVPWLRAILAESASELDAPSVGDAVRRLAGSADGCTAAANTGFGSAAPDAGAPDPASRAGLIELESPSDFPAAERLLLQSLIKDTEGFFSRHINRRISLAVTRRLARTRMTPNAMTAVSVGVGLIGAGFLASGDASFQFVGALLFLLHSILDGCDGELARLKFQESRLGGILDFWGDNVVHCAVFACLAAGWTRNTGDPRPLVLGATAIAGTLLSAGFVARHAFGSPADGPQFTSVTRRPETRLSRFADLLARRDFIYLVVLLAAFGKARWFLLLAGVGAPFFFLALLVIEASGRRLGRDLP